MHNYRNNRPRKKAFALSQQTLSPLDLYEHLPFQVAVVSNLLQLNRDLQIREIIDLEPRELRVILNIGSYMPIKAADIAYQSRLDSYTISRAVKTLRKLGLVTVQKDESNKKVKHLVLSEQGMAVYQKLAQSVAERTERLESCLSGDEKQTLMALLARLEDKAESMLAESAQKRLDNDQTVPADQKEIIRWWKKSQK